jgi:hypothetical protein
MADVENEFQFQFQLDSIYLLSPRQHIEKELKKNRVIAVIA